METEGAAPVMRGEMLVIASCTSVLAEYCGEPLSRTVAFSTTVKAGE